MTYNPAQCVRRAGTQPTLARGIRRTVVGTGIREGQGKRSGHGSPKSGGRPKPEQAVEEAAAP